LSRREPVADYLAELDRPIDDLRLRWLARSGLFDAGEPILVA
jgi:hypothetical protein